MAAINELDAFCIALPVDVCPTSDAQSPRCLAVVNDEGVGHHTVACHLPVQHGTALISGICRDRARLTVDHQLVVGGKTLTPEAYLKPWRIRLANAVALRDLALNKELQAVAVFQWWHSEAIAARKPNWIDPPYQSFGELLDKQRFSTGLAARVDRPLSTLEIDLASPGGARCAWWANDFLSRPLIADEVLSRRVEFRDVAPGAHRATHCPTSVPPTLVGVSPC